MDLLRDLRVSSSFEDAVQQTLKVSLKKLEDVWAAEAHKPLL